MEVARCLFSEDIKMQTFADEFMIIFGAMRQRLIAPFLAVLLYTAKFEKGKEIENDWKLQVLSNVS